MLSIVGHTSIYDKHYMPQLKIKNTPTRKKKVQNHETVIYNQENKLNEHRFQLQTKISIKMKNYM